MAEAAEGLLSAVSAPIGVSDDTAWPVPSSLLRGAVDTRQRQPVPLLHQAKDLYLEGHYREALAAYMEALVLDPEDPQAHCGVGETLEALGRVGEALIAFDQALRLNPDHSWAHFGRGGVLQDLRRYDEAASAYERAAELDPGEVAFHRILGVVHYLRDDRQASLDSYRRALAVEPEDALSLYGVGLVLDALGRPEEAIASYQQASQCDPEDPWPHLRLCGLLQQRDPSAAAGHLCLATALLQEDDPWGQSVLTTLRGQTERALEHVREALTLVPGSADWLRRDPDLEPLHADERFWLLLVAGQKP